MWGRKSQLKYSFHSTTSSSLAHIKLFVEQTTTIKQTSKVYNGRSPRTRSRILTVDSSLPNTICHRCCRFSHLLGNSGVVTGKNLVKVLEYAKTHGFAIPAFNCTSSSTVIAALEGAREAKAPVMIQVSQGGAAFFAGKGVKNGNQEASIAGATAAAMFVRQVLKSIAPTYGVPVIMHSDHCAKKLLPWFDGMLKADEEYFKVHQEPLFSSHMLDLSEESKEENIEICCKYFERMAKIDLWLEMEIGITGGEEDGVNNENVDNAALYTQPEDIWDVYAAFSKISPWFSIAAAFGNVHGVYKVGNVTLQPELLGKHQAYCKAKLKTDDPRPLYLVFHGGSGSSKQEIATALENGVVKNYFESKKEYLKTQVGNPDGADAPNKKYYDPRVWVREGEKTMVKRVIEACQDLKNVNVL
ncbi:fructose-bisphosphate aldolase, class II [Puccinia sorghi]|uniref:Fructose-bisphosphate aldolase n=1 Tax=Puccinia sorghi TaxID=27349 RepID=A0A0L6UHK0_9BASI|nr:fructose-bisphosphate aldolase, class II [Puccinia sorghi]